MRDYIIGSFNIRHLNYESDKDVKKDFDKLAKIIEKEKFDVIAIQEALSDSAIKHLKGILGENTWDARWSQSDKHDDTIAFPQLIPPIMPPTFASLELLRITLIFPFE